MKLVTLFLSFCFSMLTTESTTIQPCPPWLQQSGRVNDMSLLADTVSWNGGYETIQGVCDTYHLSLQTEGIYDTRMRVYETMEEVYIQFRPTQQTNAGGDIHVDRRLVPCTFLPECCGLVHDRFQQAFQDLVANIPSGFLEEKVAQNKTFYLSGHSLGGSLQLFMALYLWKQYDRLPQLSLGLAGPFIGDQEFTRVYQETFKQQMGDNWWQIEAQNKYNSWDLDGTVEGYQVDSPPLLFIQKDAICLLPVDHLDDSYGMHDLKNYRTGTRGTSC